MALVRPTQLSLLGTTLWHSDGHEGAIRFRLSMVLKMVGDLRSKAWAVRDRTITGREIVN